MALVVPDVGEVLVLSKALNKTASDDVKLRLYTNDVTPDDDTVVGDLTEATATGYAAKTLTGASWTVATATGTTTGSYAQQSFTMTTQETYYGYYVTDNAGTGLLWVERFSDGPYTTGSAGGTVKVTPTITLA